MENNFNGDWGLGIGDWGLGPIPNPQSPIPNLAKLFGIIVDREKFCLIFERLTCSLDSRLKTKSITDKEKYMALAEVMELILFLHENKLRAYDLRPSNIFMTDQGDVRMIFPLGKKFEKINFLN
jgi:hypothetical protein